MHKELTAGHNSAKKIFQQIHERYYWPKMFEDIRGYTDICNDCQRRGGLQQNNILHLILAKIPFQRIGIDIVGVRKLVYRNSDRLFY